MADVNLTPDRFPRWNTKAGAVRAGTGFARILCVGDSTTQGTYAFDHAATYPYVLQGLMNAWIPTQEGAVWSDGDWNMNSPFFGPVSWTDSRITKNSPWAVQAVEGAQPTITMMGGGGWYTPSTTSNALTFTPGYSFDTLKIHYASSTGTGTFNCNIDGGSSLGATNTSVAASLGVGTATHTVAAGTHTINITPVTVASVVLLGIETYLSTAPKVLLSNGGSGGSKASDWIKQVGRPWLEWPASVSFGYADLFIVSLGINDALAAVSNASYLSNMNTLIDHLQPYGDVLIVSSVPSEIAGDSAWTREQAYITQLETVAASFGCGLYDLTLTDRFVDWATADANGYMQENYHPNPAGYTFWAELMNTLLQAITVPAAATGNLTALVAAR